MRGCIQEVGKFLCPPVKEEYIMENLFKNLASLVKVKTIVTLVVIAVFAVLALRGDIAPDNVMIIISMVVSFYFGTQRETGKKIDERLRRAVAGGAHPRRI